MSYASSFRASASLRRLLYIQINYQNWFSRASTFRLPMSLSVYLKSTNHEQKHVPGKILKKCMKGHGIQSCYQIYIKIHLRFDKLNEVSEWFSDLVSLFSLGFLHSEFSVKVLVWAISVQTDLNFGSIVFFSVYFLSKIDDWVCLKI